MGEQSKFKTSVSKIVAVLACILMLFHIYTSATLPLQSLNQRSIHMGLIFLIFFLSLAVDAKNKLLRVFYLLCGLVSLAVNVYVLLGWEQLMYRTTKMIATDYIFGILTVVIVLFATYKSIGIWMPLIAGIFMAYAYFGPQLPGILHYNGISLQRFLASCYIGTEGIYGSCLAVSATFVIMFIFFGEVLLQYGGGDFIINLSQAAFGRVRGGSGKIAVLASSLFGMVSGSTTANVAGTGSLTIPLMKKSGFDSEYSGGVVAAASTGGQLMPPVMGAAAFVMAEMLGMAYGELCVAAAIPAVLFYICLFLMVDFRAAKCGFVGLPKEELPDPKQTFKDGWHYLISIFILVLLLVVLQWSASKAALYSSLALIVAVYGRMIVTRQKIDWKAEGKRIVNIFVQTVKGMFGVATGCCCAGIIIGVFSATSLNLRFSSLLIEAAGGNLIILLFLAMIGALILGMGLPSLSVYVIMAVIIAPALIKMGVEPLSAHLFLFYFGIMAPITPPVGIGFYVAAGIAKAKPMMTGFKAWLCAIPGFILPYLFIFEPSLLLLGTPGETVWFFTTCAIGIAALAGAIEGYLFGKVNIVFRVLLGAGAVASIYPETITTYIGLAVIIVVAVLQIMKSRVAKQSSAKV